MVYVQFHVDGKKATQGCPCSFYNYPDRECTCPPGAVQKYLNRKFGPLLDRIDLHVEVTPIAFGELCNLKAKGESSASIRERVIKAFGRGHLI